ncbi:hypothetical protein OOJ09_12745 [Mesorhizobium qingshengii]|uniref:Uncharacterized protein n=1 Tax=Mesorhizobium qingshengii TaxID=1165689 RepID=A0ABT4QU01_9HYPH|nr:hypothetical protein [Mesorhizobium qingshengii]MCZ8545054.1 hypothetical protein [Mesorhizobium qingshengii]
MRTKVVDASRQHEELRNGFIAAIRQIAPEMPADEILAVVCVFVGQLIALQDQRRFSSDAIMELVSFNIEAGNKVVIDDLLKTKGGNG